MNIIIITTLLLLYISSIRIIPTITTITIIITNIVIIKIIIKTEHNNRGNILGYFVREIKYNINYKKCFTTNHHGIISKHTQNNLYCKHDIIIFRL